jgi:hypothetical protein
MKRYYSLTTLKFSLIYFFTKIVLKLKKIISGMNIEVIVFSGGLLFLSIINPSHDHFSICLFNLAGINFCPGCGLGRSISYLLHFNIYESVRTHPLGIPAFLIIIHRIISLLRNNAAMFNSTAVNNTFASDGMQR